MKKLLIIMTTALVFLSGSMLVLTRMQVEAEDTPPRAEQSARRPAP